MLHIQSWWRQCAATTLLALSMAAQAAAPAPDLATAEPRALDAIVAMACNRQVVLLGEASHGDGHTDAVKAVLVERLVSECGFNAVLFESGVYEFMPVMRAARSGGPVTPALVAAAVGGLWAYDQELQPLLAVLATRVEAGQIILGGLDFQVGIFGQPFTNDHMYPELMSALPAARSDTCTSLFRSLVYGEDAPSGMSSRTRVNTLQACIAQGAASPITDIDADTHAERQLAAANVSAWLDLTDASRGALNRARDAMMFANVDRVLSRPGRAAKIVVWTHNAHAAKDARAFDAEGGEEAHSLGSLLAHRLGPRLFALGVTARSGAYRWSRNTEKPIPAPPPDALEAHFDGGADRATVLVSLTELKAANARPAGLLGHAYTIAPWADMFDAVLVLDAEHAPRALKR